MGYKSYPLTGISSRDSGLASKEIRIGLEFKNGVLQQVMLVILMFVAWLLVDLLCFIAYHLRISRCFCAVMFQSYASSCCIELVAQKQHSASFMFSRSNLLWFALILGVGVISTRLSLANGLDDPVA